MVIARVIVKNLQKLDGKLIVDAIKTAESKNLTRCRHNPKSKHKAVTVVGIKGDTIFVVGGEQAIKDFVDGLKQLSNNVSLYWTWGDEPTNDKQSDLVDDFGFPNNIPKTLKVGKKRNP